MRYRYRPLTERLVSQRPEKWTVSFDEIEQILEASLPQSAKTHQAWWSNQSRAQSLAWQEAGYKTQDLDLKNQFVTFARVHEPSRLGLSIEEAKTALAQRYGVTPAQIEITIRG